MNKQTIFALLILLFLFCCSYAHTPGDAALRAGHPEAAADLYMKGAELGDANAALKLGLLISDGTVAVSKYGTAIQAYERACQLGSLPGCHNIGVSYQEGENGLSKNPQMAYDYYVKAAERGYMQSQYNLASLYSDQAIQPQNNVEGYKWLLLAQQAALKCKDAPLCDWILRDPPAHKTKLRSRMTEEEIKQAEGLAEAWRAKK